MYMFWTDLLHKR